MLGPGSSEDRGVWDVVIISLSLILELLFSFLPYATTNRSGSQLDFDTMTSLLDLSHEVLHCVLLYVEPADLASLNRSCRVLNDYINNNKLLCKELYLQRWVREWLDLSRPVLIQ